MENNDLPVIDLEKCDLCGRCVCICPKQALSIQNDTLVFSRPQDCDFCTLCEDVCPQDAIQCAYSISWDK